LRGLKAWQEEKRYIQASILNSLYDESIVFKGDTYLWFFNGLPRFSEDLDFTAISDLPSNIMNKVSERLDLFGIYNESKIETNDKKSFSFKVMAQGPLYTSQNSRCVVYVEISKREELINKTLPIKLNFPEYLLPIHVLNGINLDEVGAEKIRAITSRNKARDVLTYII